MATFENRGDKWRARVRRIGHRPYTKTFATKKEAIAWAKRLEVRLATGGPDIRRMREKYRLSDALVRYEMEVTPHKRGAQQERHRIGAWLKRPLARLPLDEIKSSHLATHRDQRLREGASPNTVRLELAIISHLFTIARKEWGYEHLTNPVELIRKPTIGPGRDRRLEADEERVLLEAAYNRENQWLGDMIVLAIETAMRQGELLALRWEDINFDTCVARLKVTKNGAGRRVPLSSRAIGVLKNLREERGPVFDVKPNAV